MRKFLIFLILFLVVSFSNCFAIQINERVYDKVVETTQANGLYVVGTENMVYVFSKDGELKSRVKVRGLTDIEVKDDMLIVASMDNIFPNVIAYNFPSLTKLWEFRPTMKVFNIYLVWHDVETRSWCAKIFGEKVVVCSGHKAYMLDKNGNVIKTFEATNDVWDVEKLGNYYYVASQDGNVYILDEDFNINKKLKVVKDFELIDPITNSSLGIFTRSVWDLVPHNNGLLAVCEDGNVYFIKDKEVKKKVSVESYSTTMLTAYYKEIMRETSLGDVNFKNLVARSLGDYVIVFGRNTIVAIKNGEEAWKSSTIGYTSRSLCRRGDDAYIPLKPTSEYEKISVISLKSGETKDILKMNITMFSQDKIYDVICDDNGILLSSQDEIKLLDYAGNVKWYFPKLTNYEFISVNNMIIAIPQFRTGDNPLDPWRADYVIAIEDGKKKWEYTLPLEKRKYGYISRYAILNKKYLLLVYNSVKGDSSLIIINLKNGDVIYDKNPINMTYAGILDKYLLNKTLMKMLRNFDFSIVDSIPSEIIEGRIEDAIRIFGREETMKWLETVKKLPLDPKILRELRDILQHKEDFKVDKTIIWVSVGDLNGDGVDDILVSTEDLMVLLNGLNFKTEWIIDCRRWRYDNEINRKFLDVYTRSWFDDVDGVKVAINDINDDGIDDIFLFRHDSYMLFQSKGKEFEKVYEKKLTNFMWDKVVVMPDIDGDGVKEFLLPSWRKDKPPVLRLVSPKTGASVLTFEGDFTIPSGKAMDINGDGKRELIFLVKTGCDEASVKVIDGRTKRVIFTNSVKRMWEAWRSYYHMLPADFYDINNDGKEDLLIGFVEAFEKGVKIRAYSIEDGEEIDEIVLIEGKEFKEEDLSYVNNLQVYGDYLIVSVKGISQREGMCIIYDLKKREIKSLLHDNARKTIISNGKVIVETIDGKLISLNISTNVSMEISTKGNEVSVYWKGGYGKLYVDGTLTAESWKGTSTVKLVSGKHKIKLGILSRDGYEVFITKVVEVFLVSSLSYMNIAIGLCVAAYITFKIYQRWRKK
ncbi:MAG TPA: hypothetical protein ENG45_01950 [Candidatus Aenigmarchaeota archaeon]|nr:hypothetical protein [Candidatus Aenigmarchaeota archaeon]